MPGKFQSGFSPILIVILLAVIAGSVVLIIKNLPNNQSIPAPKIEQHNTNNTQVKIIPSPSVSKTPTSVPTKQVTPTPTKTPIPTSTPTPSPTSAPSQTTPQPSGCNTSTDLGNLTVNIQPQSGQSLIGDAGVTMSNGSGDCAGNDSRLPYTQVIHQGSTSIAFPSFRPGKFHIQVGYHLNKYDNDVNINPGDNSITVTVSD